MPPLSQCRSPPQPPPSFCFNHNDSVTLKVVEGGEQEKFSFARGLLTWHSAFFAAALDPAGSFKDSTCNERELTEKILVVRAFHCWVYTGRLLDPLPESESSSGNKQYLEWDVLCKLWVFADFRGIPPLKNAAIDMLHEKMAVKWETPGFDMLRYAYQNSAEGSQLRQFFTDIYSKTASRDGFLALKEQNVPIEFLWDAIPNLLDRGSNFTLSSRTEWAELDRCRWHDHSGPGGKLRMEGRQ